MSNAKHTPGPWEADTIHSEGEYGSGPDCGCGFTSFVVRDSEGRVLFDCVNSDVVEVYEEYDGDEGIYAWDAVGDANMKLAAAAPELLEALQALDGLRGAFRPSDDEVSAVWAKCSAAIAKATGSQS